MSLSDNEQLKDYRVSVRLTRDDFERLERLQELLQARKGRTVRITQATVIMEALEVLERELTRPRKAKKEG